MASLLSFRQFTAIPQFTRSIVNRAALRPVPAPRGNISGDIATASDFLKAIGRSAETKVTVESWDELWKLNGPTLRKAGLGIRDRRYILWCLEKYRQGQDPELFAHPPRPKKTIRGWGPAVQNGKRIRG